MFLLQGQWTGNADSLLMVINQEKVEPKDKAIAMVELANYYIYAHLDSATHYIDRVFHTPELLNALPEEYHKHHLIKGWTYHGTWQLDKAKEHLEIAYNIASKYKKRKAKIEVLYNLAAIYSQSRDTQTLDFVHKMMIDLDTLNIESDREAYLLGEKIRAETYEFEQQYFKALKVLNRALKVSYIDDYPNEKLGFYYLMGGILKIVGNYQLAEEYLLKAMDVSTNSVYENQVFRIILIDIYLRQNDFMSAWENIEKFKNESDIISVNCFDLAMITHKYYILNDNQVEKALAELKKAEECVRDSGDEIFNIKIKMAKAIIFSKSGNVEKTEQIIKDINSFYDQKPELKKRVEQTKLAKIRTNLNLWKYSDSAIESFEDYQELQNENVDNRIKLQERYLSFVHENEVAKLQSQISEKNRRIKYGGIFFTLLTALLAFFCFRFYKKQV